MKTFLIVAITFTVLGGYAFSLRQSMAQQSSGSPATRQESPFYCNRQAINQEQTKRKEELGKALRAARRSTRELPDGYEFELPADATTFQAATEWAAMERLCCPFFEITLRLEREKGPLWLRLTGRDGVKQFIQADFGPWMGDRLRR